MLRNSLFVLVAVLVAACGTLPPPAYEQPALTQAAQERATAFVTATAGALETLVAAQPTRVPVEGTTVAATATLILWTHTPTLVPPTATPTEIPATATPIAIEPTVAPTTDAAAGVDQSLADNDQYAFYVDIADAANGAELVKGTYLTTDGAEWSCSTCHNFTEDVKGLGPSLVGVGTRAFSRVEGMGPYTYLHTSIRDPQAFVVPGFETVPQPMPHFSEASLSEEQVFDIIAYLITLK
jgi:hypothetical protein